MATPRFSLDDPVYLRRKLESGCLYANPAAFSTGGFRILVHADGGSYSIRAVSDDVFMEGFEAPHLSPEALGLTWAEVLRALAAGSAVTRRVDDILLIDFQIRNPDRAKSVRRAVLARMAGLPAERLAAEWEKVSQAKRYAWETCAAQASAPAAP